MGVFFSQTTARNGQVIVVVAVDDDDDVMLISDQGTLIRTPVKDVSVLGRNTQGVTLVKLGGGERLVSLERIVEYKDPEKDLVDEERVGEDEKEDKKDE